MSAQSRTIPVEVYLHIISHIPAFNTADLARLLRTSKQLFALVAPALYTSITSPNPSEGPCDLQAWFKKLALDTGLPLSAVGLPEMDDGSDHDEEAGTGDAAPAAVAGPPTAKTVKAHLLDLTRTLTVHERHGGQGADEIDVSKSLDMPRLKHLIMISPGSAAADQAIKTSLRPRIAISTGVSLHGRSSVGVSYCPDRLEECYVLVEPSDPLPSSANRCGKYRTFDQGLQLVQQSLNSSLHQTHRSNREATTITYILAMPPCERYEVPRPFPHSGMMMTMEYSPEYAPGWMHAFTKALGPAVAERLADGTFSGGPSSSTIASTTSAHATEASLSTTKRSLRSKPLVRFVNFGALSGADVGMAQAAMSEITDRLRRSLQIFVRRALHSPLFDDIGVEELDGVKASVNDKIVWEEMDDWLRSTAGRVDQGKLDVLRTAGGDVGSLWARQYSVAV